MKNALVFISLLAISLFASAQYYYKDIIGTREMNQTISLYLTNKVLSAEATGFDAEGIKNSDFSETHSFNADRMVLKISNRDKTAITNESYHFNGKGLMTSQSDTSSPFISTTTYTYNENNDPVVIANVVTDSEDSIYASEVHQWFYNAGGKAERMLRIVNKNDTTDVRFTLDDNGNVTEELPFIKKISREKTYYYYDRKNRLTDIVRYNVKAGRLLPDYMFEYSDDNRVIQKITTLSTMNLGYLLWRYVYDPKGLKVKEASFNKNKTMLGKIEYTYRFAQ